MRIEAAGPAWRLHLNSAGPDDQGAASPGDCEIVAEGQMQGTQIAAKVVPFEGEIASATAGYLAEHPAYLRVSFDGDVALLHRGREKRPGNVRDEEQSMSGRVAVVGPMRLRLAAGANCRQGLGREAALASIAL